MTPEPVASCSATNPTRGESSLPTGASLCTRIWTTDGLANWARSSRAALYSARSFDGLEDFTPVCAAHSAGANNRTIMPRIPILVMIQFIPPPKPRLSMEGGPILSLEARLILGWSGQAVTSLWIGATAKVRLAVIPPSSGHWSVRGALRCKHAQGTAAWLRKATSNRQAYLSSLANAGLLRVGAGGPWRRDSCLPRPYSRAGPPDMHQSASR